MLFCDKTGHIHNIHDNFHSKSTFYVCLMSQSLCFQLVDRNDHPPALPETPESSSLVKIKEDTGISPSPCAILLLVNWLFAPVND